MLDDEDVLKHFGVLGMKWGIRKDRVANADHAAASSVKGKHAKELSNSELRAAISRIQMEKQYKDLNKRAPSAIEKYAADIVKELAKEQIKELAKEPLNKAIGGLVSSASKKTSKLSDMAKASKLSDMAQEIKDKIAYLRNN